MDFKVISFYRYITILDPKTLVEEVRSFCQDHGILGRILIGEEGINGAASGKTESTDLFKKWLRDRFEGLTFREQDVEYITYHKLVCRFRDEVCVLGVDVDMSKKGSHVSPTQLKEWLDNDKDIILLDARNKYEIPVGKFKNAETLPIQNFNELPKEIVKRNELKDKTIVMYCTGGVRCEKSSAFLKENGFKDVYQLEGGIINYVNQYPDTHFEGSCFVFDDRLVSKVSSDLISNCSICNETTDNTINCHNLDCDKLILSCDKCQEGFNSCCSEECKSAPRQRPVKVKPLEVIGKVEHFYAKPKVAYLKLDVGQVKVGDSIIINGPTTGVIEEVVTSIYVNDEPTEVVKEGEFATIPVSTKVRPNDKLCIRG